MAADAKAADTTEGGGGIISVLEVAESDFATSLAEANAYSSVFVDTPCLSPLH